MTMHYRATVSAGDGMDFVISDGSLDNHGTRFNPKGWELSRFRRNPQALWAHGRDPAWGTRPIGRWENVRVEGNKLVGRLVLAAQGTAAFIDELRSMIEQRIIRAVSVGFNPIKMGNPAQGGFDFEETELLEVSLVSVPSNKNALSMARSLNISESTIRTVFGEHAEQGERHVRTGEHAANPPNMKAKNMSTLAQRIAAANTAYTTARDAYQNHVAVDDFDMEQADTLKTEMEERQARLTSLKDAERALAATTLPNNGGGNGGEGGERGTKHNRRPLSIKEREPEPGDLVIRAGVCTIMAQVTQRDPIAILEERYRDHEATNVFVRAAVDPAKTSVQGWASELIETETVAFLETLRDISFFPRLAGMGTNLQFGVGRGALKVPSRATTPSISGSFVAEGAPIPVRRFGLTSKTLSPHKMGVISYFTKEIAKYSNPQIENLLRQEIRGDTADTIDTLLIDTTAGSATRPAGLLNGISALTASTAGGWAAIMEDIETLASPFDTAKAGRNLVLLMNKREARKLSFVPGPDDKLGSMRQLLTDAGITPIASVNVTAGRLVMIDAADFAAAAGDQPEFDASEQAVIHAEDTSPAQISAAGSPNTVSAPVISMFQTASIALRMLLDVTWAMRRDGMVQWIDGADWTYSA